MPMTAQWILLIILFPLYFWLKSLVGRISDTSLTWIMLAIAVVYVGFLGGKKLEELEENSPELYLVIAISIIGLFFFMRIEKKAMEHRDRHLIEWEKRHKLRRRRK